MMSNQSDSDSELSDFSFFLKIGWVIFSIISLCCGGALCLVFWERYLDTPALLTMRQVVSDFKQPIPKISVCPTPERVADLFAINFNITKNDSSWLVGVLNRMLRRKHADKRHLSRLDFLLTSNNLSLVDALKKYTPPCSVIMKRCRWQNIILPCHEIFRKDMIPWGLCCSMTFEKIPQKYVERIQKYTEFVSMNQIISLVLNCTGESKSPSCEFATKFHTEDWKIPEKISAGYIHRGQLTFALVSGEETALNSVCDATKTHSRRKCLILCKESICRCADPMRPFKDSETGDLPLCSVSEFNCLVNVNESKCDCLLACTHMISKMSYSHVSLNALEYSYDPFLHGLNESTDAILDIVVQTRGAKLFYSQPTETWFTLLSSLGGVFNMFLGVGVFSALEIIYLIFIQVPMAVMKSAKIDVVTTSIKVKPRVVTKNVYKGCTDYGQFEQMMTAGHHHKSKI